MHVKKRDKLKVMNSHQEKKSNLSVHFADWGRTQNN